MIELSDDLGDTHFDVAVLGAGPAGANAAIEASSHGLTVALIDEAASAGGQVWRAPSTASAMQLNDNDADRLAGDELRVCLKASSVLRISKAVVWSVVKQDLANARYRVELHRKGCMKTIHAHQLVVALGAVERVVPFPGWTLPGVFGLAAATAMLKRDGNVPGHQVAIAGQGPLLFAVAAKALSAQKPPQIIVDAAARRDWMHSAIGMARSYRQLMRGAKWMGSLALARVSTLTRSAIVAAHGNERLQAIDIAPLAADGAPDYDRLRRIEIDTLFIGNGLSPVAEIPRLLGATIHRDSLRGGFSVARDQFGRTDVNGLLVAGDGAGVYGAVPSAIAGTLAGLACARDSNKVPDTVMDRRGLYYRQRYRRSESCADASCRLMQVPTARMDAIPEHTIVCRCEMVSRADISAAASNGVSRMDELKTQTRLGMGACQGRMCERNAASLLSLAVGNNKPVGMLTQRIPLRPLPVNQLTGSFTYDDIPVPAAAPI